MPADQRFILPPSDLATREALTQVVIDLRDGTQRTAVPTELLRVLGLAASELAAGHAVAVQSYDTVLTSGQAAELLGVSRTTVTAMIAAGELAATDDGVRCTVALDDLLAAKRKLAGLSRDVLGAG